MFQTLLVVFSFLGWFAETIEFSPTKGITYQRGLVFKVKKFLPSQNFKMITLKQGPIGRLFGFGTIVVDVGEENEYTFSNIPTPQQYIAVIDPNRRISRVEQTTLPKQVSTHEKVPNINLLLTAGESATVEFKTSYRNDLVSKKVNKELEKSIMKTIAGFMNSRGGVLIVGVGDNGKILGLEEDYKSLTKHNKDGFENHFNLTFKGMIGLEFRQFVNLTFHRMKGKEICLISVEPSDRPVYVRAGKGEEFYIRTGNATSPMTLSEAASYIKSRWKSA